MVDSQLLGMFDIENETPQSETRSVEEDILEELVDELSFGLCIEVHRSCKIGMFKIEEEDDEALKEFKIIDQPGLDVFGQPPLKKHLECVCPSCHRSLSASRFAPHLAKCMGMGRNSSRLASKRLAINSGKIDSDEDDERDIDWTYVLQPPRTRRMKKEKPVVNPLKRTKSSKLGKNGDIPSVSSTNSDGSGNGTAPVKLSSGGTPLYDSLSLEERKRLLLTTCGVISEHTKKMCTKSLRCPQHSEEQRQAVRRYLLGLEIDDRVRLRSDGTVIDSDDIQVDIDTYEDGDGQALRDTLSRLRWETSSSGNPSPTDSTSTTNSNEGQTKKRKKGAKLTQRKKKRPPPLQLVQSSGHSDVTQYDIANG
ncbi:Ataxin-7-like protein 3 [Holothuria leucospilota]|uniref:SAGA-associated factor 11 homolog n=1 Tax=Holothuria leucospilota TaxID=206669 RepID=A0A9Q1C0P6_HOLLE|nr:Ataxin-7-like protein 3 [Holothuria leucospilota]